VEDLELGGQTVRHRLCVVPIQPNVILGIDFLKKTKARIDFESSIVTFKIFGKTVKVDGNRQQTTPSGVSNTILARMQVMTRPTCYAMTAL
jgi:hypothetical protein